MELLLQRNSHDDNSSLGSLSIDGRPECYVVEDEPRLKKVKGETRIPAGRYEIKLKPASRFDARMTAKYGATWHRGMLWLQNVPGFEFILIHTGNTEKDTEGCLIVGRNKVPNGKGGGSVSGSAIAYEALYPKVRDAILRGEKVFITVRDES